jgi:hypothetical protein
MLDGLTEIPKEPPFIFDQFEGNPLIAYIFDIESIQVKARL